MTLCRIQLFPFLATTWLLIPWAQAQVASVWSNPAGGSFGTAANWIGNTLPNFTANTFLNCSTLNLTQEAVLSLDGDRSAGTLVFGDTVLPGFSWSLRPGSPESSGLTLAGTTVPVLQVNNQITDLSVILAGNQGFEKRGAGTLAFSGSGDNVYQGALLLTAGTVNLARSAGTMVITGDLQISGSGALNALGGEQIADTATLSLNSSAPAGTVLGKETMARAIVSGGASPLRLNDAVSLSAGLEIADGQVIVTSAVTPVAVGSLKLSGGTLLISPDAAASTLRIGPGGIHASGGTLQIGTANGGNPATLELGGDYAGRGTVLLHDGGHSGTGKRDLSLGNALRTFDIADGVTTVNADLVQGSLLKKGAGTLLLGSRSVGTLTGPLSVAAGTLELAGTLLDTPVVLADGAGLSGNGRMSGTSSLTFGSGGGTRWGVSATLATPLLVAGKVTVKGAVKVQLASGSFLAPGTPFKVLDLGGSLDGNVADFQLENAEQYRRSAFSLVGGSLRLEIGNRTVKWTGSAGADWDVKRTLNWDNGSPSDFAWGDRVSFDDSAVRGDVRVSGSVTPTNILVNNNQKDFVIGPGVGAEITGATLLTKQGTGKLTVAVPFRGAERTLIQAGTVEVGQGGNSGNLSSGAIVNSGVLRFNRSDVLLVPSVISGTGTLVQAGSGTITMAGSNSYTGETYLLGGTLVISSESNLGANPPVLSPAALTMDGGTLAAGTTLTMSQANRGVTLGATGGIFSAPADVSLTVSLPVTGTGRLESRGAGVVILNKANDYSGGTLVRSGRLQGNLPGAFGSGEVTVPAESQVVLPVAGNFTNAFRLAGEGIPEVTGSSGAIRLGPGARVSGNIELLGNTRISAPAVAEGNPAVVAGIISGEETARLLEWGGNSTSGAFLVAGNNTYRGGTAVTNAVVSAAHSSAFGLGPVTVATLPATPAGPVTRVKLENGVRMGNRLTMGTVNPSSTRAVLEGPAAGTGTWSGPIVAARGTLTGGMFSGGGGTLILSGPVSCADPVVQSSGRVVYGGGGNYPQLAVTGEALLGASNGLPAQCSLLLGAAGDATFDLNGYDQEITNLVRQANTVTVINDAPQAGVLTLNAVADVVYSGGIQGRTRLALVKKGPASLTLSNTVSHAGPTSVVAGRLVMTGTMTSSPVTVAQAATLAGTGTLSAPVLVQGTLAPGVAVGRLSFSDVVTFGPESRLECQINSWTAGAGIGYDTISADAINLTATQAAPAVVKVAPLGLVNFSETSKVFTLATADNVSSLDLAAFRIDASGFGLGSGSWSLRVNANRLELVYTAGTVPAYDQWAAQAGLVGPQAARLSDADDDGLPNLMEFALNDAPLSGLESGKRRSGAEENSGKSWLTLTFPVRAGAVFTGVERQSSMISGIRYTVEAGDALNAWLLPVSLRNPADSAGLPGLDPGWEYRTFRTPATGRVFLRVGVQQAP